MKITVEYSKSCIECLEIVQTSNILDYVVHYDYDEIMIIVGKPMLLYPNEMKNLVYNISSLSSAKIYLYVGIVDLICLSGILHLINGLTYTIYSENGITEFEELDIFLSNMIDLEQSFYLNIYKNVNYDVSKLKFKNWNIKRDFEKT